MSLAEVPKEIDGHGLLTGKVVVVTAAAGTGIGSAVARRALAEGADVVVSDHHERRLGETKDQLIALGLGRVESVVCDVTSTAQVDALIASTTARLGRLDVLVNNAGLGGQTPVVDMTDDEWDRVLNVTLTSVMRATRAALRYFRDEFLIVLATSSSEPVLPRLLSKLERIGCDRGIVGLVVPTGYSFNLTGTAVYLTLGSMFISQACVLSSR